MTHPNTPPDPYQPVSLQFYTAAMMYHATGEGMQIQVLVTMAQSESDARQRFLDHFSPGRPDAQAWYGRGLQVHAGVHRPSLDRMLDDAFLASLEHTLRNGVFAVEYSFNLS